MYRSSAKADTVPTDLDSSRKKKATQVSLVIMKYILTQTFKYITYLAVQNTANRSLAKTPIYCFPECEKVTSCLKVEV